MHCHSVGFILVNSNRFWYKIQKDYMSELKCLVTVYVNKSFNWWSKLSQSNKWKDWKLIQQSLILTLLVYTSVIQLLHCLKHFRQDTYDTIILYNLSIA